MRSYRQLIIYGIVAVSAAFFASCEEDTETNADDLSIPLTAGDQSIKAPGKGQYRMNALSTDNVTVKAQVPSSAVRSFTITKKVNLVVDPQYGQNGVLTVDPASFDSEYTFNYTTLTTDIDKLVGFTFRVEKTDGSIEESDLTLVVTLSPRDNIPTKRWIWKSKIWVDGGNLEDIKECEKDNYYLFNPDGTMSINFGTNTGSGSCNLDALIEYYTWELSEDEKTMTMTRNSDPNTEVYRVKTLTTEKLDLEIDYDLSVFGLSSEETFLFKLEAAPR
jgi:hypothetical protein